MLRVFKRSTLIISLLGLFFCLLVPDSANLSVPAGFVGPPAPPEIVFSSKTPQLRCQSAVLYDNNVAQKIFGKQEYEARPIASITKLMTALLFLDFKVDWQKAVEMLDTDVVNSSSSHLRSGDVYKVVDLFHTSLVASDNRATRAMVRSTGLSHDSFVVLMNQKAQQLGLLTMRIEDVTGLSENNVCSAEDCARLLNIASSNPIIREAMQTDVYQFSSLKRHRNYRLNNTNRLIRGQWHVEGGKTGYILESGWCLAARVSDWRGNDLTVVVLGASSPSGRFKQATKLFQWAFGELSKVRG